jgi:5,6-dimethylbenzimidazole synthase
MIPSHLKIIPMPHISAKHFSSLRHLIHWRRDVRNFKTNLIPEKILHELFSLADQSPSVGLSQPWRVMRIDNAEYRQAIRDNFEQCNNDALSGYKGDEKQKYTTLKLAGFDQAPVQLAVFCDHGTQQGKGLGRQTMPEMLDYSCVCMIQTLWLAARAKGIGMGWVSILEPSAIKATLQADENWKLIAYLLLGFPEQENETPELEKAAWQQRSEMSERWFIKPDRRHAR